MKHILSVCFAFIILSLPVTAQTVGISYSPFAAASLKCTDGVYNYSSSLSAGVTYEFLTNGDSIMLEGFYSVYNFKDYKPLGEQVTVPNTEQMKLMSLMAYFGWTINKKKRAQFPIYAGLGVCSFDNSPQPETTLCAGLKARAKFYVTNRFGLFAGVNAGLGLFIPENDFLGQYRPMSLEFGLIFDLLDTK